MGLHNPRTIVPSPDVDFRAFYPYSPHEVKHRKRTTSSQLKVLETVFKRDTKPNASLRNELAAQLDMTARGVQVRFSLFCSFSSLTDAGLVPESVRRHGSHTTTYSFFSDAQRKSTRQPKRHTSHRQSSRMRRTTKTMHRPRRVLRPSCISSPTPRVGQRIPQRPRPTAPPTASRTRSPPTFSCEGALYPPTPSLAPPTIPVTRSFAADPSTPVYSASRPTPLQVSPVQRIWRSTAPPVCPLPSDNRRIRPAPFPLILHNNGSLLTPVPCLGRGYSLLIMLPSVPRCPTSTCMPSRPGLLRRPSRDHCPPPDISLVSPVAHPPSPLTVNATRQTRSGRSPSARMSLTTKAMTPIPALAVLLPLPLATQATIPSCQTSAATRGPFFPLRF